jgi:hypothetical protein
MELQFIVEPPASMTPQQRDLFLELLKEQGQVSKPNMRKVNSCSYLCLVYYNGNAIGIGAIKQIGKSAFSKSNSENLAAVYEQELGYLYVKSDKALKNLGIGKTISKLLLKQVEDKNVFASTALGEDANSMIYILRSLGFELTGKPYIGGETGKQVGLFTRPCTKSSKSSNEKK